MRKMKAVVALAILSPVVGVIVLCAAASRPQPPDAIRSPALPALASVQRTTNVPGRPDTAAVTYISSLPELVRASPVGRPELLRKLTAPAAFDAQSVQLQETIDRTSATFGSNFSKLSWVEGSVTATVERTADQRVKVAVWSVAIVGSTDMLPQEMWRTFHVTVVEVGGVWLVDEVSSSEGPTPSSSAARLPGKPSDFVVVAGWDPVVKGERV